MRVTDDRYSRDLRRYNLALRMIGHEARTQTICTWTGLSDERVRKLYHSYSGDGNGGAVLRHRGPSPYRLATFLRSPTMRSEAAVIAGMCHVLGVMPEQRLANTRRDLPSLSRGERICFTFELYRGLVMESEITLELLILLVTALVQGDELGIGNCGSCGALILIDHLGAARHVCMHCKRGIRQSRLAHELAESEEIAVGVPAQQSDPPAGRQQSLF